MNHRKAFSVNAPSAPYCTDRSGVQRASADRGAARRAAFSQFSVPATEVAAPSSAYRFTRRTPQPSTVPTASSRSVMLRIPRRYSAKAGPPPNSAARSAFCGIPP